MPVYSNGVAVTAVYQGSSAISSLNNGTTPIPFGSSTTDPYWDQTVLRLKDQILDESSFQQTITNTNVLTTTAPAKFGTAFSGSATTTKLDIASAPSLTFGLNDLTIEMWAYKNSAYAGNTFMLWTQRAAGGVTIRWNNSANNNHIQLYVGRAPVTSTRYTVNSVSLDTWHHIAVVRKNLQWKIFVDGVDQALTVVRATPSGGENLLAGTARIGHYQVYTPGGWWGEIDDIRVTNGYARYWSQNVAAPADAFPTTGPSSPDDQYWRDTTLLLQESLSDDSLSGHTLTAHSSLGLDATSWKYGSQSLLFDGSTQYLSTTVDSSFQIDDDGTIELWFKTTSTANQRLLNYRTSGTSASNMVSVFIANNVLNFRIDNYLATGTTTVTDNAWHHVACVKNSTSLLIFLDGVQEASTAAPASISYNAIGETLSIGRDVKGLLANWFEGNMDSIRWTKGVARYPSEPFPTAAFAATNGDPDFANVKLLLQDSLADDSYQGHTVVAYGTAGLNTDSAVGNYSLDLDNGSLNTLNNYITVSGSGTQAFEVGATEDVTVECWVKFIDDPTTLNYFQIIRPAGVLNANSWYMRVYSSKIQFLTGTTSTTTLQLPAIQQNTWHHIACVRQAGTLKIYLDGAEVLSTPHSGTISTYGSSSYQGLGLGYLSGNHFRLDGLRITIGTARYTANFTPPTTEFPN